MTSGAPSTQVPWPSKVAALHFRAEENGTVAVGRQPDGAGQALAIAWSVALGAGSATAIAPRTAGSPAEYSDGPAAASSRIRSVTARLPSVIVPVLSKQSTSTRANVSTAGSS